MNQRSVFGRRHIGNVVTTQQYVFRSCAEAVLIVLNGAKLLAGRNRVTDLAMKNNPDARIYSVFLLFSSTA